MKYYILIIGLILCTSCNENMQPKPKGFLALNFPKPVYKDITIDCPYTFEINSIAKVSGAQVKNKCWIDINYPTLNGTLFITYQEVNNNLEQLLKDGQKLPLQHTQKADVIQGNQYINELHNTYGMFYEVEGNAASQAQFYLTDSTSHFITGSIYFKTQPNFDSIYPASEYLKRDIKQLMETVTWTK